MSEKIRPWEHKAITEQDIINAKLIKQDPNKFHIAITQEQIDASKKQKEAENQEKIKIAEQEAKEAFEK